MDALQHALHLLPARLFAPLVRYSRRACIHEIRLRRDLPLSVTVRGQNHLLDENGAVCGLRRAVRASASEISHTASRLCDGSVYRHVQTLARGFLVTEYGVRAAFSGSQVQDYSGRARTSLSDFCGINLRIPHHVEQAADGLLAYYRTHSVCSTLVYSPPGAGKTTLLRSLALGLSRGAAGELFRVCVLDERGELFPSGSGFSAQAGLLDVLSGRPKAQGIETAVRLLSPQVIVCDELGEEDEVTSLLSAQFCGAVFVASAHAQDRADLYAKPRLRALLEAGVFSLLCRVEWCEDEVNTRIRLEAL